LVPKLIFWVVKSIMKSSTPFASWPEVAKKLEASECQLASEAIVAACQDAGIDPSEIDGMASYTMETTPEVDIAKNIGYRMEVIGPDEIRRINPFIHTDGVIAGAWTLDDGHVDPAGTCNAMAIGARNMGASIIRHNRVTDINQRPSGEWEVVTEKGTIIVEFFGDGKPGWVRRFEVSQLDDPSCESPFLSCERL